MIKKFLLIIFSLILLPAFGIDEPTILPSEIGIVDSIEYIDLNQDDINQVKQEVDVKILTGENKNQILKLDNMLTGNPYYDIKLSKGTKVILHVEEDNNGINYSIEDIKRSNCLVWLSLIFCGLLIYVGRKKGIASLLSIGITLLLITHVLSPLILLKINPIFVSILICIISTAITMYLVGGFNAKSTSALLGSIASLIFACVLSYLTIIMAHLTGFSNENSIFLYTAHPELNFIGITIATMILATLGAVMDVAMSIASTINEIYNVDNSKTIRELFLSGMNVGKDIIGTMANTLILVYLGGSLPLLLLANNIDLQKFLNLNQVVTEIASALIGSIAIVICVPFTAIIAAKFISSLKNKKNIQINLDCK